MEQVTCQAKLVSQDRAVRLRRRALQTKEHRKEWLGHKSVVFAGEFCTGERRYDEAVDEFRTNFDLWRGDVGAFAAGREFCGGANAFAGVAGTGEKRQFAGYS